MQVSTVWLYSRVRLTETIRDGGAVVRGKCYDPLGGRYGPACRLYAFESDERKGPKMDSRGSVNGSKYPTDGRGSLDGWRWSDKLESKNYYSKRCVQSARTDYPSISITYSHQFVEIYQAGHATKRKSVV